MYWILTMEILFSNVKHISKIYFWDLKLNLYSINTLKKNLV